MRTKTEDIRQLYADAQLGIRWEDMVNSLREHIDRLNYVMQLIWKIDPWSIIDVGPGRGIFGCLAQWKHCPEKRIIAVDITQETCNFCVDHMGYSGAACFNVSEPFELHERFDLALCMEVLEHVPSPETVIANVRRHLKPGGLAIFSCPEEQGPVDGEFHVRHVSAEQLFKWVVDGKMMVRDTHFLRSTFCEKPKWQGWNFVIATKGDL